MKFGVVVFPGSNCDHDTYHVVSKVIGQPVDFIWHRESTVGDSDAVNLPGGFSYGDYLAKAPSGGSVLDGAVKSSPFAAASCSGFATGFRYFAKPDSCRAL